MNPERELHRLADKIERDTAALVLVYGQYEDCERCEDREATYVDDEDALLCEQCAMRSGLDPSTLERI